MINLNLKSIFISVLLTSIILGLFLAFLLPTYIKHNYQQNDSEILQKKYEHLSDSLNKKIANRDSLILIKDARINEMSVIVSNNQKQLIKLKKSANENLFKLTYVSINTIDSIFANTKIGSY